MEARRTETLSPETERSESSSALVAISAACVLKDRRWVVWVEMTVRLPGGTDWQPGA